MKAVQNRYLKKNMYMCGTNDATKDNETKLFYSSLAKILNSKISNHTPGILKGTIFPISYFNIGIHTKNTSSLSRNSNDQV